jgi:hypothetical protein
MKFVIHDKKDKMQLVNYLKDMESPYTVEVKKHRNTRSNETYRTITIGSV